MSITPDKTYRASYLKSLLNQFNPEIPHFLWNLEPCILKPGSPESRSRASETHSPGLCGAEEALIQGAVPILIEERYDRIHTLGNTSKLKGEDKGACSGGLFLYRGKRIRSRGEWGRIYGKRVRKHLVEDSFFGL